MSEPFLGQISIFGFNFPPRGYALCDGQLLPINQNQSLFSLLGTIYGGDGRTTFALPDLRGRVPIHVGSGRNQGERGGEETHTLTAAEMPSHRHVAQGSTSAGTSKTPSNLVPAVEANGFAAVYATSPGVTLSPTAITNLGGGTGHENMQPFLTLSFAIALSGIFPSRN